MTSFQQVHDLLKLFTVFLLSWSQPSLHSLENEWISHDCTSRGNHTYCTKSLKFMRTNTCRESNLIDFKHWDFMSSSVLLKVLPVDAEKRNYVRQVRDAVFSVVRPVPLKYKPSLIAVSSEVLTEILDLKMSGAVSQAFVEFIAGNKILPNSVLLSHRYGGHQFGEWADQLGDGRAVLLGEYTNRNGEKWELQLKGSGRTPYSRHGDSRAVLRSSVREFLVSEAMSHLGVPTSRAAAIVVSNDLVWRDQFYDGHPMQEKAAVVLRLAKSWFRIGSLEILTKNKELDLLKKVVDFVIDEHFPAVANDSRKYLNFFAKVVSMTAELIAKWQSVGFAHGVCNTDNFSLLSITIDYGPFAFLDEYNPDFVPNSSDEEGRYSYKNQPSVGFFNMEKLLQALKPVMEDYRAGEQILLSYADAFNQRFLDIFRQKLGLLNFQTTDEMLIHSFLWMMSVTRADFTMSFRELSEVSIRDVISDRLPSESWALTKLKTHRNWKDWLERYTERLQLNGESDSEEKRKQRMQEVNPRYVLRNWMAQSAIEKAEKNDHSEVWQLLDVLRRPFTRQVLAENRGYSSQPPSWASRLRVSCSS
ncbi:protein adenylyltransferase SelO-like isoform X1 [Acropora palmata]|uniref:protein adenylyltransferase SelO-like isoform X1 n=1 Tax=Acropora palmata TaxID=6131 RepID=UPI003DA0459E